MWPVQGLINRFKPAPASVATAATPAMQAVPNAALESAVAAPAPIQESGWMKYSQIPRESRLRSLISDQRSESQNRQDEAAFQMMADDLSRSQQELSATQQGIAALRQKLSAPLPDFTPKVETSYGDLAALGAGLFSRFSPIQVAQSVRGDQEARAAAKSSQDMAAYQQSRQLLSSDLQNLLRTESDQSSRVYDIGNQISTAQFKREQDQRAADEKAILEDQKARYRADLLGQRLEGQFDLQAFRQKFQSDLEQLKQAGRMDLVNERATAAFNALIEMGFDENQARELVTSSYTRNIAQAENIDARTRTENATRDARVQMLQSQYGVNEARAREITERTRFIEPRFALEYERTAASVARAYDMIQRGEVNSGINAMKAEIASIDRQLSIVSREIEAARKSGDEETVTRLLSTQAVLGTDRKNVADALAAAGRLKKNGSAVESALKAAGFQEGKICTDKTDCSMFARRVMGQFGKRIPDGTSNQVKGGKPVSMDDLQPGDLIFFDTIPGDPDGVGHVGVYIGGGRFAHASSTGKPGPSRNKGLQYKYRTDSLASYKYKPVAIRRY